MPLWLVGSLAAVLASNAAATKAGSRGGLLEKRRKPLALMPLSRHVTKAGQTPQTTQAPLVGDIKFPFADDNGKSDVLESVWPAEAPVFSPTTKTTTTTSVQPLKAPAPAPPPPPPAGDTIIHQHIVGAPSAATPELRTLAAAAAGAADQAMQAAAVASAGGAAGGGGSATGALAGAVSAGAKADQALAAAEAAQQSVKSLRDSLRSAAEARARELMKLGGVSAPR